MIFRTTYTALEVKKKKKNLFIYVLPKCVIYFLHIKWSSRFI